MPAAGAMPLLATVHVALTAERVRPVAGTLTCVTRRSGKSESETLVTSEPLLKPDADAVIVTGCDPSTVPSATPEMLNVAVACPAGIVTLAGTVASVVSELASCTTSGEVVGVLRRTVARTVPDSRTTSLAMLTESVGPSSSVTSTVSLTFVDSMRALLVGLAT